MPQPNKVFLKYLYGVLVLGQKDALGKGGTPNALSPSFTPNQKFLQAAVAYTEACFLKLPNTDAAQATKLAQLAFQVQQKYGHQCIPHHPNKPHRGPGPTRALQSPTSSPPH